MNKKEKELIKQAIKLSETYNMWDKVSLQVALRGVNKFLKENFDIENNERSDEWKIEQFNRHRGIEDRVHTIEEFDRRVKEIFGENK